MSNKFEMAQTAMRSAAEARKTVAAIWADAANAGESLSTRQAARVRELTDRAEGMEQSAEQLLTEVGREERAVAQRVAQSPRSSGDDSPYGRREHGFIADLVASRLLGDTAAAQRIAEHDEQRRSELAAKGETREVTSGGAGSFIPTIYAGSAYAEAPSSGRPYLNLVVGSARLPDAGLTIDVPTFATLPTTAAQVAEGSAIADSSPTAGTASATVYTFAGGVTVSRQAIERSTPEFDDVMFRQLTRSVEQTVETAALSGGGSSTFKGALTYGTADGAAAVVTIGTADVAAGTAFLDKLAEGIADLSQTQLTGDMVFVMAPRRWIAVSSYTDGDGRPYVSPVAPASGRASEVVSGYGGVVGYIYGIPVVVSGGVSTTFDTNRDRVLLTTRDAARFWESGGPNRLAVDVAGGDSLLVRLSAYRYSAYTVTKPGGLVVYSGAGMTDPFA